LTYLRVKGRQWHTVILTTCNQGRIPHSKASIENERRLFLRCNNACFSQSDDFLPGEIPQQQSKAESVSQGSRIAEAVASGPQASSCRWHSKEYRGFLWQLSRSWVVGSLRQFPGFSPLPDATATPMQTFKDSVHQPLDDVIPSLPRIAWFHFANPFAFLFQVVGTISDFSYPDSP
jgi:hypothetical protein